MNGKAVLATICVFLGCCLNVVFLELIVTQDPGATNLVTFGQFFFISLTGLILNAKCFSVKPTISINDYVILVVMFFAANVAGNYSLNFYIPMPLHMIFRSGTLLANMIMGIWILQKSYTKTKYFSVVMITIGIILCSVATGMNLSSKNSHSGGVDVILWWCVGITLLSVALLLTARMGIYQEVLFKRYGKHPNEALFYTHMLPLPGFLFLSKNINDHFWIALESEKISIGDNEVPKLMFYILGNILTQYMCIKSVYVLTAECSSLSVTLILTLRKFASLVFSVYFFKNAFTGLHWIGAVMVLGGTLLFCDVFGSNSKPSEQSSGETKMNGHIKVLPPLPFLYGSTSLQDKAPKPHIAYKILGRNED